MIKVTDVAYTRFTAPDLDRMEDFLTDFGLDNAVGEDDREAMNLWCNVKRIV